MPYNVTSPVETVTAADRPVWPALWRGWSRVCPACGKGALFDRYLKVAHACSECGTELHHHRADDAPPYFTMVVVGHVVVGLILAVEKAYAPETWLHLVIWLPLALGLTLWLLPRVKGALVAYQWALRMHGFGKGPDPADPQPWPGPRG